LDDPEGSAMITSKLTSKAQTTVPQPVRAALRLQAGDEISYVIADDKVIIAKAVASTAEDPFATFEEWDSEADRKAYAGL
jgi:antitoxin PrlF